MRSLTLASPPFLALLQPAAVPPPPPASWSYADTGNDGLSTNAVYVPNIGRGCHNNDLLAGTGAGVFARITITSTQFRVLGLQAADGSDFSVTLTDASGAVVASGSGTCYAATDLDSSVLWESVVLPSARYTIEVTSSGTGGGRLYLDCLAWEGTDTNLPFQDSQDKLFGNLYQTGGYEYLQARNGTVYYGYWGDAYQGFTPPMPVTRLQVYSILDPYNSEFFVTVTNSSGQVVLSTSGTARSPSSAQQNSQVVYDTFDLPPDSYTIRLDRDPAGGGSLVVDGYAYRPA